MNVCARLFNSSQGADDCRALGVRHALMDASRVQRPGETYPSAPAIREAIADLGEGGVSCSTLVGQTIPVYGRQPRENERLHQTLQTLRAMGEAGVGTLLLYMLEERPEGGDREQFWQSFLAHYRPVVQTAAQCGVNLAMHAYFPPLGWVDGNAFFERSFQALPDIHNGICYDPGIMALCGDDPMAGLQAFRDRVHFVQIRDIRADWRQVMARQDDWWQVEVFPGEGIARIEEVIRYLQQTGYTGGLQPEHLGPPDEATQLSKAMKYLQDLVDPLAGRS